MKGRPIENQEFWDQLVSKNCGRNQNFKERNRVVLVLMQLSGIRPIELCLMPISLFITAQGGIKKLIILPEEIAYDGNERPVLLENVSVIEAVENYISWLKAKKINTNPSKSYLGFNPNLSFIVNNYYKEFGLQSRGKKIDGSKKLLPFTFHNFIDDLIKKAGLWGEEIRRDSFVKSFVIEAYKSGVSVNDLIIIAGISELTVQKYLTMDIERYSPVADWFIQRGIRKEKRLESLRKMRRFKT